MRFFRLDVTTLLAGLLAGILPACLLVVLSYLYLAGLKPEVLSSLQEPHLERGKRRVALLADTVERRRRALVAAVQQAIVGDDLEVTDEVRSDDFPSITAVRWYLEHLDDATYTQRRRSHWPDAYEAGDRGARLVRQLANATTEEERAAIRRQLAALPPTAVDELGFSFASLVEYTGGPIEEALGRQLLLWPDALPPEEIAWRLAQRDYRLTLSALPTPIEVRSTESPFLPSTIDLDPEDPEQVWLAFRNGPSGGILAVQLGAEGFLERSLTELEERFPTPEGVVFRVERVESGQDPDRLWGRWPLNAPFDHGWELWAGPSGESDPLLVTILQRLGTIHYLYGGLSILALLTVGSFLLTGLLSRRVRDSRQKDDFVRLVSHELRTPIASIRMIAETLRLGRVRSDDERQEFLGQLEDESRRLADLIERVLEYGKKSGEREVVTDPEELVQTAVGRFRERQSSGVEVQVRAAQEFHPVLLDREAVIGVVYNLLSNAAKYSSSEEPIVVTVGEESRHLFIAVRDHGAGIRRRDARKIFRPFYRGQNSTHARGFGLGLAYCREVARHHGGRITLESRPGEGSCFTLEIPLLRAVRGERARDADRDAERADGVEPRGRTGPSERTGLDRGDERSENA